MTYYSNLGSRLSGGRLSTVWARQYLQKRRHRIQFPVISTYHLTGQMFVLTHSFCLKNFETDSVHSSIASQLEHTWKMVILFVALEGAHLTVDEAFEHLESRAGPVSG